MTKALVMDLPRPTLYHRVACGLARVMATIAMGIYAICALAVAMDWGLESVLPIEQWADEKERRAAESSGG